MFLNLCKVIILSFFINYYLFYFIFLLLSVTYQIQSLFLLVIIGKKKKERSMTKNKISIIKSNSFMYQLLNRFSITKQKLNKRYNNVATRRETLQNIQNDIGDAD
jgi:hypothetical protein